MGRFIPVKDENETTHNVTWNGKGNLSVDDLNDREKDGKIINAVHYKRPEGYDVLGERFARQGYALIKGEKPAKNGRP